ncbi:uncharacterized protein BDW43DRAFT_250942 [Aspergillus alliaceus]|uniref:uncharacterized protein n=1 Tax=Petromyces alliaceus TaxID=209559 RepID=UPI0012A61850|nr:uncharacterized protein BDW43DRAFT_250942 [Aspergillus alliaceus]KAB8236242.1 hypothetical protein BDW43DRAFT_250942 [Aspergillus alliaceus]
MSGLWLSFWTSNKFPELSRGQYMGIYADIFFDQTVALYSFSVLLTAACANASKNLFECAMHRTLRAPMSFFDTTPLGHIINQFSHPGIRQ